MKRFASGTLLGVLLGVLLLSQCSAPPSVQAEFGWSDTQKLQTLIEGNQAIHRELVGIRAELKVIAKVAEACGCR